MGVSRKPPRLNYFNFESDQLDYIRRSFRLESEMRLRPILTDGDLCTLIDVRSATSRKMVVDVAGKEYFLKQVPWYVDDTQADFAIEFQKCLGNVGVPVPSYRTTRGGSPLLSDTAGTRFTLSEYVRGRRFTYDRNQALAAAELLALVHSCEVTTIDGHVRSDAFIDTTEHLHLAGELARERSDTVSQGIFPKLHQIHAAATKGAVEAGWQDLIDGPVHGDFSPWNMQFHINSDSKVVILTDFDNAHVGPPVRDVAEMIATFGYLSYLGDSTTFADTLTPARQRYLLDMYTLYSSKSPVGSDQLALLPFVMEAVVTELVCLGYIRGDFSSETFESAPDFVAACSGHCAELIRESFTDD